MDIIGLGTINNGERRPRRTATYTLLGAAFGLLSACTGSSPAAVEDDPLAFVDEVFAFNVENDLQYGSALDENGVDQALHLDLYQPAEDDRPLRPAVVWIHGGSYTQGHKGEMTEFARRSARHGFVSVSINYRLRENAVFNYLDPDDALGEEVKRDAQHDAQAAVRWLRSHASDLRIHPDHIYVVGYSAGAVAGLRAAAKASDPGSSGNPGASSAVTAAAAISGSLEPGLLEAATGATLLIHGQNDTKVPIDGMATACNAVPDCTLVPIPLGEHNLVAFARETITAEIAAFLHGEVMAP
jgi:dienelactone hydrolase